LAADLLCFVLKYKMVAVAMLNFIFVWFYGITTCRTSNLACVWNFVQVRAIATKLWAINGIENSSRRHLEFIIFVDFGHRSASGSTQTLLQNFVNLRQSAAELLLLCKNPRWRRPFWTIFVQYFGIHVCKTSNVIHVPNFVQICSIMNKLWAIN